MQSPASKTPFIQKKLAIGSSNGPLETEADRVADKVVGMSEGNVSVGTQSGALVQRKCTDCEKEGGIQMKASSQGRDGGMASSALTQQIQSSKGGGNAMDASTQTFMESRFGADFSDVKIHTDSQAVQMSRDLNAQAFTVGNDIYFNEGKYDPATYQGKHLLAHELTHTIQQGGIQRKMIQAKKDKKPKKPKRINVWGFWVRKRMCKCAPDVQSAIDNAVYFSNEYKACDTAANKTGSDVEDCVDKRNPTSTVAGSTSAGGGIKIKAKVRSLCERVVYQGTKRHEYYHARQADRYAKSVGGKFYTDWVKLKRRKKRRLKILKKRYPAEHKKFMKLWNSGREWVKGEVESYGKERLFLLDVKRALKKIC
ncbi:DUF4157 domain-containing protein [Aureisphaera galaxeae]|uniref:eCIS core domain-containing protein n=1 Tax=Aureisphaera galaxeae TaxID=1538023 RepID=UPI0023502E1A|nr:DUF4157 domain-containing protein [Aureisphaera galaxeae]